jgi:hypothetical protein
MVQDCHQREKRRREKMKKALVDNLGRIVGTVETQRGSWGNAEYGRRDKDGILHVHGIAKLTNPSDLKKAREAIEDLPTWEI